MSPIGRIFIVLNLVLAVAFLAWSATHLATAQDWKAQHAALQTTYDTDMAAKEEELSTMKVDKGKVEGTLSTTRTQKEGLEAEKTRLETDLSGERQKTTALNASVDEISGTLQGYATTIENLRALNETLGQERAAADEARHTAETEKQDALEEAAAANEALVAANKQIASLEMDLTSSQKLASSLGTQLEVAIASTGFDPKAVMVMPVIDGAVLNVNYDVAPGLVAINKGSDSGVQRGFTFDVYRGGEFKGQVKVENVQPNMCTCVVVKTYEGRSISQGDSASTRI